MKKYLGADLSFVVLFAFVSFSSLQCSKGKDQFCGMSRSSFTTVTDKEGIIGYYQKYNHWAVYSNVDSVNNIDSRMIGLVCDVPSLLKIDGLRIKFSGTYQNFNAGEKITPQMGGDQLYFLQIIKLEKR
jgi:hypothetical protein